MATYKQLIILICIIFAASLASRKIESFFPVVMYYQTWMKMYMRWMKAMTGNLNRRGGGFQDPYTGMILDFTSPDNPYNQVMSNLYGMNINSTKFLVDMYGPKNPYFKMMNEMYGPNNPYFKIMEQTYGPNNPYYKMMMNMYGKNNPYVKMMEQTYGPDNPYTVMMKSMYGQV